MRALNLSLTFPTNKTKGSHLYRGSRRSVGRLTCDVSSGGRKWDAVEQDRSVILVLRVAALVFAALGGVSGR